MANILNVVQYIVRVKDNDGCVLVSESDFKDIKALNDAVVVGCVISGSDFSSVEVYTSLPWYEHESLEDLEYDPDIELPVSRETQNGENENIT